MDRFSKTSLSPKEEVNFQAWIRSTPWYSEFIKNYGEEPNLNDPNYDYRGAWKSGIKPEISPSDNMYHWGSVRPDTGEYLKGPNHPTLWKQKYFETTGKNPDMATKLEEIRFRYPQYQDLSDQQLAEGLHKKFYSDMPFDEFSQKIGLSVPAQTETAIKKSPVVGPIVPGESISTITGKPVTPQEVSGGQTKGIPEEIGRPMLEAGGMLVGGTVGTGVGLGGTVAGSGLGYAAGKNIADIAYRREQPETIGQSLYKTAKDIKTGAQMEMGGQIIGKLAGIAIKYGGDIAKGVLGKTTGAGPGMVETATKGGQAFKEAMRGKISGPDIVANAKSAVQELRTQRAVKYIESLDKIAKEKGDIDIQPIQKKFLDLLKQYNIKIIEGGPDFTRIAMGKKGRVDIEEIFDLVSQHGSKPGDNTAAGLDVLKRQLDDFYSESSQARQFVTSLRNTVKDTISKSVPEYARMTKGYSEATNLIKDIEAGLMLRKQGMTGRVVADQTLRRLTSSMRDNFELRKELVQILGKQTAQDLEGQIGGYTARNLIPTGLVGSLSAGTAGVVTYINPKFWPLLVAASPRTVGEFLNIYGKGFRVLQKTSPAIVKAMGYETGKILEENEK